MPDTSDARSQRRGDAVRALLSMCLFAGVVMAQSIGPEATPAAPLSDGPLITPAPTVVLTPLPPLVPAADERFADLAFGASVALSGGTLMIAAAGVTPASGPEVWPLEPAGRSSVYVYDHQTDGSLLLSQRLVPPYEWDRRRQVWMRTSVVLEGDTAVVVADSGFAFVYRRENGAWGLTTRLAAEEPGEYFSGPAALEADRIALASQIDRICHRDQSCFPNSVYLFRSLDGTWRREARLDVVGLGQRLNPKSFGSSLALAGDRLAASYMSAEVVSVFEPDATGQWHEVQRLDSGRLDPLFAPQHVAMDTNTLVHLLYRARPDDPEEGRVVARVRIFEHGESGWSLQRELALPRGAVFTWIETGAAVALHGDVIVAGVRRVPDDGLGEVYLLVREPHGWELRQHIVPPGEDESPFGYAVAFDGDHLVVGRPGFYVWHPGQGFSAGTAYIYDTVR